MTYKFIGGPKDGQDMEIPSSHLKHGDVYRVVVDRINNPTATPPKAKDDDLHPTLQYAEYECTDIGNLTFLRLFTK